MRKRVVVTGMGCISPVGNTVKETWDAMLAGKSGAAMITSFDASKHKTRFAAEVKGFDAQAVFGNRDARKMDRFTQFATVAAQEALGNSGLKIDETNRDRIGILIGTGIGGLGTIMEQAEVMRERGVDRVSPFLVPMMISDSASGMLAIRVGARGPNMAIATACLRSVTVCPLLDLRPPCLYSLITLCTLPRPRLPSTLSGISCMSQQDIRWP